MKLIEEIDAQKLRGGFYTPPQVVDACWERIGELLNGIVNLKGLEPSAGDGSFVRGLARLRSNSRLRRCQLTCIELLESEAEACRGELSRANIAGDVVTDSFFSWLNLERGPYNILVGNPPFIRYQFIPDAEREAAEWLLRTRGHDLQGVSNYWIPFVLLGLDLLEPGGVFSLVLPSELLSTVSGGQVRAELIEKFDSLTVDLYPRKNFPDILQDVLVLSGVRATTKPATRNVTFSEHSVGAVREWQHAIAPSDESWTRFLLSDVQWEAFQSATTLRDFSRSSMSRACWLPWSADRANYSRPTTQLSPLWFSEMAPAFLPRILLLLGADRVSPFSRQNVALGLPFCFLVRLVEIHLGS